MLDTEQIMFSFFWEGPGMILGYFSAPCRTKLLDDGGGGGCFSLVSKIVLKFEKSRIRDYVENVCRYCAVVVVVWTIVFSCIGMIYNYRM